VDIGDPAALELTGQVAFPNYLFDLEVTDGIGYGANPYSGFYTFDLTDPYAPLLLSNIPVNDGALPSTVAWFGDYLCLGSASWYYAWPHCTGVASVPDDEVDQAPRAAPRLIAARPNPFNPQTSVDFVLGRARSVRIAVYDLAGHLVRVLADEHFAGGTHTLVWNGRDAQGRQVASDVYFVRLSGKGFSETRKVVLAK